MTTTWQQEFENKFGMTIEEWEVKTIKSTHEMKIKNIKQRIEDVEFMDDSPTKTRMLKIWNTKLKKEVKN